MKSLSSINSAEEFLPMMLADIELTCMDLAVDVTTLFADLAPAGFMDSCSDALFPFIVDRGFDANAVLRNKYVPFSSYGTVFKEVMFPRAQALLLKLMEVTDPFPCTLYLLSRLEVKKPKISLEAIRLGVLGSGAELFPVYEILASLGAILNSSDISSRKEAMSLLVEIEKWVGKATTKVMERLRTEQEISFERLKAEHSKGSGAPTPTLTLRRGIGREPPPGLSDGGGMDEGNKPLMHIPYSRYWCGPLRRRDGFPAKSVFDVGKSITSSIRDSEFESCESEMDLEINNAVAENCLARNLLNFQTRVHEGKLAKFFFKT